MLLDLSGKKDMEHKTGLRHVPNYYTACVHQVGIYSVALLILAAVSNPAIALK